MFEPIKVYATAAIKAKTAMAPMKATPMELKAVMTLLLDFVGGALPPVPH